MMDKFTTKRLCDYVVEIAWGYHGSIVQEVIKIFLEELANTLSRYNTFTLNGIGTFRWITVRPHRHYSFKNKRSEDIAGTIKLVFTASRHLKDKRRNFMDKYAVELEDQKVKEAQQSPDKKVVCPVCGSPLPDGELCCPVHGTAPFERKDR